MAVLAVERQENFNPQALNFRHELEARSRIPDFVWRFRVDQNLLFYTREYILEENITHYSYQLRRGPDGLPCQIYSPGFEEEGDILKSFQKGAGIRARAECVGFEKIQQRIFQKEAENNFFVWVSLPDRREDGFGTHSFTFIGQILNERIEMVAYKNWLTARVNATALNKFLSEDNQFSDQSTDLDFLQTPVFLPGGVQFRSYLDVVHYLDPERGDFCEDNNQWFLDKLEPYRRAIILALEINNLGEAEKLRKAHDNFALALLKGQDTENKNMDDWAARPTTMLRGSCGFSGSEWRPSMSWFGIENKYFNCPRCKGKIESGKGITTCPHCGARKEDYQRCD